MAALVERLHGAGTPLYLLSNAPDLLDRLAARAGAPHAIPSSACFRDYVVSGLVGCSKPDAAIYDLVCRTGGFRAGRGGVHRRRHAPTSKAPAPSA